MKHTDVLLTIVIIAALITSCGPRDTPEIAAKEWTGALFDLDGNKLAERTCTAQQANVQNAAIWASAFAVLGQQYTGQQTYSDISDLHFETTSKSGNSAQVRVFGEIRTGVLAIAQSVQVDTSYSMIEESGKWKWCGEVGSTVTEAEMPTNIPSGQRYKVPPSTLEQIVAAQAFEQYASENFVEYNNARLDTTNNDGTFADVVITLDTFDPTIEGWIEKSAVITLRLIGGSWKADVSNINLTITNAGQATFEALQLATQRAAESASESTAVSLQSNLGGTLIYVLDGSASIAIQPPSRKEITVSPLSGQYRDVVYESLELAPTGDGFYFATDTDFTTPAIFFSNLDGSNTKLLMQFEGQTYIKDIAVSPDNSKLAILTGSFVGPEHIWIVPTSGGERSSILETYDEQLSASSWATDSSSFYVNLLTFEPLKGTIVIFQMDGSRTTIAELPAEAVTEDYFLLENMISVSPNGNDIVFGGGILGLLSISNGNKVELSDIAPVCNPTWSSSGDRVVFASGNGILVFNLSTGEFTNPYNLPVSEMTDNCPVSFDWIP